MTDLPLASWKLSGVISGDTERDNIYPFIDIPGLELAEAHQFGTNYSARRGPAYDYSDRGFPITTKSQTPPTAWAVPFSDNFFWSTSRTVNQILADDLDGDTTDETGLTIAMLVRLPTDPAAVATSLAKSEQSDGAQPYVGLVHLPSTNKIRLQGLSTGFNAVTGDVTVPAAALGAYSVVTGVWKAGSSLAYIRASGQAKVVGANALGAGASLSGPPQGTGIIRVGDTSGGTVNGDVAAMVILRGAATSAQVDEIDRQLRYWNQIFGSPIRVPLP